MLELLKKQEYSENMRKKFAEEREKKAKQQEILRKEKEKEILKILQKNDEIMQKKIEDYNKKQIKILERQKMPHVPPTNKIFIHILPLLKATPTVPTLLNIDKF